MAQTCEKVLFSRRQNVFGQYYQEVIWNQHKHGKAIKMDQNVPNWNKLKEKKQVPQYDRFPIYF